MLEGLFNEEGAEGMSLSVSGTGVRVTSKDSPPPPRLPVGLCGLYNQGATCYMNSLLQTLLLTPEFREALFQLGPEELGLLENKDAPGSKVRVIPIQLQRLFTRMLLLNQHAASTSDLTDSFGWNNNEQGQQHDAQELNRILFSAIEDSLVGTSGQSIIRHLYHGTIVNQIICEVCGRVSEREEDFLDLTVPVEGATSLESALWNAYINMESLDGKNQYRCERCCKLVNAKKGAKIRHLPDILTVSLLRFSFDFVKMERYKETGKFVFPTKLDMGAYCDQVLDDTLYELFSVVIHRGSTHGGHYHAYIRDVDALGKWTHPDEEEIFIPTDPSTGVVDFIECDSPIELVQAILARHGKDGMQVDKLGAEINRKTGVPWNKRFKRQYGPLHKFLKKYDDKFVVTPASSWVRLKTYSDRDNSAATHQNDLNHAASAGQGLQTEESGTQERGKRSQTQRPLPGHCWFNFDDSRIAPILEKEIEKQFSGKESAYMLTYRRSSMMRPQQAMGNPSFSVPDSLYKWVMAENQLLQEKRAEYELKANTISIEVHFDMNYDFVKGALQARPETLTHLELTLDRRRSIAELKSAIRVVGDELVNETFVIHTAKDLPAGLHLVQCITGDDDATMLSFGLDSGTKLFVWDGIQVKGHSIPQGEDCEPILLIVSQSGSSQYEYAYPKNLTLGELRLQVSETIGVPVGAFNLSRITTRGEMVCALTLRTDDDGKTIAELRFNNGDQIIVEREASSGENVVQKAIVAHSRILTFLVEDHCGADSDEFTLSVVEIEHTASVQELKAMAMSKFNIMLEPTNCRIRVNDDNLGLKPPVHEEQSLESAMIRQGMRLVLEPGPPPTHSQITLGFSYGKPGVNKSRQFELIVDKSTTVQECLCAMLLKAELPGDEWHLRKTNWCGEPGAILDDCDLTLDGCHLHNGDHLLIEEGKLPPKGFVKIAVWLISNAQSVLISGGAVSAGMISWITTGIHDLLSGNSPDSETDSGIEKSPTEESGSHVFVGHAVVSKQGTLEELKQLVSTLPIVRDLPVPTPNFLRLRVMEGNHPTTVLRGNSQTVQRLKLTNESVLGVQILHNEEDLNANEMLLNVQLRVADTKTYLPPQELIWDTTKGPSSHSLRQAMSDMLGLNIQKIMLAKHVPEKYEWLVISEQHKQGHQGKSGAHKKGAKKKSNLRHAPFYLKDGDTIGVKDMQFDPYNKDNFDTVEDENGRKRLREEAAEKKKQRDNRRKNAVFDIEFGGGGDTRKKRDEPTLSIKVDDFR